MITLKAGHGSDHGQFVHDFGRSSPVLGDLDAGNIRSNGLGRTLRFRTWLWVEGLELAGAACHPEQDAGAILLFQFVSEGTESGKRGAAGRHCAQKPTPANSAVAVDADIDAGLK